MKKRAMIIKNHPQISVRRRCEIIDLNRSSFYYAPMGVNAETLALMAAIDRVFTAHPFFGFRQISKYLAREGIKAGRHRVCRMMRLMGLEAFTNARTRRRRLFSIPFIPTYFRK